MLFFLLDVWETSNNNQNEITANSCPEKLYEFFLFLSFPFVQTRCQEGYIMKKIFIIYNQNKKKSVWTDFVLFWKASQDHERVQKVSFQFLISFAKFFLLQERWNF